jgi:hypothetical protein
MSFIDTYTPSLHTTMDSVWLLIDAELEPQYDMTLRVFTLSHDAFPHIAIEAASYDLARRGYYLALENHIKGM